MSFVDQFMAFSFLNAIRILKVPEHYINRKIQYGTDRTAEPRSHCAQGSKMTEILDSILMMFFKKILNFALGCKIYY